MIDYQWLLLPGPLWLLLLLLPFYHLFILPVDYCHLLASATNKQSKPRRMEKQWTLNSLIFNPFPSLRAGGQCFIAGVPILNERCFGWKKTSRKEPFINSIFIFVFINISHLSINIIISLFVHSNTMQTGFTCLRKKIKQILNVKWSLKSLFKLLLFSKLFLYVIQQRKKNISAFVFPKFFHLHLSGLYGWCTF